MFIFAGFPSCAGAGSTHHDVLLLYLLPQTDFFLSLLSYSSSLPSCCVQNNRHIDPLGSHPPFISFHDKSGSGAGSGSFWSLVQVLGGVVWEVLVCWGGSGAPIEVWGGSRVVY